MVAFAGQRRVLRQVEEEFVRRQPSRHLLIDCGADHGPAVAKDQINRS